MTTSKHTPNLSATDIAERVEFKLRENPRKKYGELAENVLAYVGAGNAAFVGILEALSHYEIFGKPRPSGSVWEVVLNLPWFNIIVLVICVAPKTLGRATVGKYLDRLPFIGSGAKND